MRFRTELNRTVDVLVSALLFRDGALAWLRRAWQAGSVLPLGKPGGDRQLIRVLGYAKVCAGGQGDRGDLALYRPFVVPVLADPKADASVPKCQGPDDQKFLDLAHRAKAFALVTGDRVLPERSREVPFHILTPAQLRGRLEGRENE